MKLQFTRILERYPYCRSGSSVNLLKCINFYFKFLNTQKFDSESKLILNCRIDNIDNIIKEIYKRIIIPLYIPALILVSLLLIFKSKENINYPRYRILVFLVGFVTIILSEMTIRLINEDFLKNIKFFIIPLILLICLYSNFLIRFTNTKFFK